MSQFKLTIQRLNALKGEMREKLLGLKAHIFPANTLPEVEVEPAKAFGGKWYKRISFSGVVKRLNAIYRFIAAKARIINKHEAKAISAPAVEIEADSAIKASKAAPLAAHPAKGISVDQKERVSVYAKLVAYRRAACVYIKQLFFKRTAKLQAAPGAVAKYTKAVKLHRTSKAIAAESAIMESRFIKVQTVLESAGCSAPAQIVPATDSDFSTKHTAAAINAPAQIVQTIENTVTAKHTATASKAAVVPVNINSVFKVTHSAKLYSWYLSELDDTTLSIFQGFSGVQSGEVLEVDLETESVFWANAMVTDGTLNLVFAETATPNDTILEVA